MDWEKTYLESLPRIERIAGVVARQRGHLNPDETTEFVQVVRVALFLDDYAIFRKFEGRSSLWTYLTSVIGHLLSQYQVEKWGKWRPSAEANRLGMTATELERLITRDGHTFNEAVQVLTTRAGATVTPEQLWQLYLRLPNRNPRPNSVSDEVVSESVAVDGDVEARVEAGESELVARKIKQTFDAELPALEEEDRIIFKMHFQNGGTFADIARALHLDQKKLYKRVQKVMVMLRKAMEANGVSQTDVDKFLERGDREIRLNIFDSEENLNAGPSNDTGEEDRDPEE
jgi:RNA polymerase sigma factor for flagellar operon FliA